jgi:hypothetical protein
MSQLGFMVRDHEHLRSLLVRCEPENRSAMYELRPSPLRGASLTFKHIQKRDGRWCIVDLVGKHGGADGGSVDPETRRTAAFKWS